MFGGCRTCCRYASSYSSILRTPRAEAYLAQTLGRLKQAKEGLIQVDPAQISHWQRVAEQYAHVTSRKDEIEQLLAMAADAKSDDEFSRLIASERMSLEAVLEQSIDDLARAMVPLSDIDVTRKCQMELSCGVGGTEAMLFTAELFAMYQNYAGTRRWSWQPLQTDYVAPNALRSAVVRVDGDGAYAALRFEAGTHRVQRFPLTDQSRMHTSTASLIIMPEPDNVEVVLTPAECKMEAMRASGPGGQNVNKRSTAVRLTHLPTGMSVHVMDERFQHLNIQIAYQRLAAMILQQRVDAATSNRSSSRKLQMGSKARAEKVRTYNFKDDRVTDHRLKLSVGNLADFMNGGEDLDRTIRLLSEMHLAEQLEEMVEGVEEEIVKETVGVGTTR